MLKKLLFIALALCAAPAFAQVHVTVEKGDMAYSLPSAQDTAISHFEVCFTQGPAPVACTATSTFAPLPVASKAADPANAGFTLYHSAIPPSLPQNKAGESTLAVVRACTGTAIGTGCGALSNAAPFILDLSSPSNLTITQKP